ncbi:alpha/beta fold hydrolase [Sphingobacterium griseoflavum]|uniref:AB hydrolase-1 domain-containing protein n=1 Tax=Sphingobacterium griseoflavum TaxID=1474952 RepID=A0ABQ3HZ15_9SPHI|nr:alpha/beta hydrolase [Sphingobacterium griseoflavum]GHE49242.1 hypothetical protein GCM10017764_35360 [Sphingobacterium griseoflavum]
MSDELQQHKNIYIFSGLGADERAFQKLDLDPSTIHHIRWISAFKNESMADYAARLLEQIKHDKPILIGLSFGGMIAVEIAKLIAVERVVLLASAKSHDEIPPYFRWAGKMRLHALLPTKLFKRPSLFLYWLFGTSSTWERKLLREILRDTDPDFLAWALRQIALWTNKEAPMQVLHIHGTADRVLPIRFIKSDIQLLHAGHFMTLNRATELSALIREYLSTAGQLSG